MNIPKELYKKFSSHRVAQFFFYLLFISDNDGNIKTTLRQMAEDNELSTRRVSDALNELEAIGACETKTKQKGNKGGSIISICNYAFYEKTLSTTETKTKQKRNKEKAVPKGKNSIEEREHEFELKVIQFVEKYSKETIRAFFNYWTERNKSGTKMRFELEKTWETAKRLQTWASREKVQKSTTALKSSEMNYDKDSDW